ncbi:tagaturonate reductase [Providencia heimbachae]|uniref:tagaturonate reductase n=1 Tax=Providencia heimbachae TaxID=333962 RepID=UPI0010BEDD61|nr:tagaturonate reductase [Providencia heimbachae]QCJ71000.1 tagaturonate reductase [Providencia heimbachae]
MKKLNRENFPGARFPTRIIQFGEGNFLRAFVDWIVDVLNEKTDLNAGITIIRPINTDFPPSLNCQDGLYTTLIRGLNEKGEKVSESRLIRSVNNEINVYKEHDSYLALAKDKNIQFVFSNTTEAGISYNPNDKIDDTPPISYPAKLTQLLFARFNHFNGDRDKGWVIIPCELIDYNGEALKEIILRYALEWKLPKAFVEWIETANTFCSTLVDRIVTGYPRDEIESIQQELGYQDEFVDTAEYFYLFVIQGPDWLAQKLCLDKYPMNVHIVDDIKPYKERKVAILNGAHTAMVPIAWLCGLNTVGQAMEDKDVKLFIEKLLNDDIIPVLDLPEAELRTFADAVTGRFQNPYIQHQLLSIALNSMTKFKTRLLPQLMAGIHQGYVSERLCFALAALLIFYRGQRSGEVYPLQDDEIWLTRFAQLWPKVGDSISSKEFVSTVLSDKKHWEQDLSQNEELVDKVSKQIDAILNQGMRAALNKLN